MRLLLSHRSIPELKDLSKKDRKEIMKACTNSVLGYWQFWLTMLVCGGMALAGFMVMNSYMSSCIRAIRESIPIVGSARGPVIVLVGMVVGAVMGACVALVPAILASHVYYSPARPYVRAYLEERARSQDPLEEESR